MYDLFFILIEVNNWGLSELNGYSVENCVIMFGYFYGKFVDVECYLLCRFICERVVWYFCFLN